MWDRGGNLVSTLSSYFACLLHWNKMLHLCMVCVCGVDGRLGQVDGAVVCWIALPSWFSQRGVAENLGWVDRRLGKRGTATCSC